jgi:hypothetical protein
VRISDSTGVILSLPNSLLLFNTELPGKNPGWKNTLLAVYSEANKRRIPFYFVSTNRDSAASIFSRMGFQNITVLNCDFTAIRTAARANPTLYLLRNGIVADKWSYADFDDALQAIKK